MKIDHILKLYQENEKLVSFADHLKADRGGKFQIKGLVGSQSVFLAAALYRLTQRNTLIILNDKEDALYYYNDLQGLMPKKEILLFPASYKRPYQVEEIDNANVLQRAEVLNELNHTQHGRQLIITFAEALNEKVVNKKALVKNTLEIVQGTELGMEFVLELLEEFGFEREDYVYEPGQFAVRGGILDVFSFAHELPYRIEFFGDEIDTIRTFDPVTQMSEEKVKRISLIPNIQQNLRSEEHVSFLDYISPTTLVFSQNLSFVEADLERLYTKAEEHYKNLLKASGKGASSSPPEKIYYAPAEFRREINHFSVIELTTKSFFPDYKEILSWPGKPQPAFHKEFTLLASHLKENTKAGIDNYVIANSEKQIKRLEEIFEEVDPDVKLAGVSGEIHGGFVDEILSSAFYTDHQIFDRYHRFKTNKNVKRSQAITLKQLKELNPGDFVVHIHHGIGKFAGLHTIQVGKHIQ
ncbi:MAG: transcription-repair coupling factor, partial [Bacteroidetes bacterium]|nr:transcription-repair coupling factor [Bacteroidota bacterium]